MHYAVGRSILSSQLQDGTKVCVSLELHAHKRWACDLGDP